MFSFYFICRNIQKERERTIIGERRNKLIDKTNLFIVKRRYRRCFKKCISSSFYQILVSFSRQGVFSSLIIRGIKLYIIALYRITLK